MTDFLSYMLKSVLDFMVSDYCMYATGVVAIIGILGLVYRLTGKAR